MSKKTTKIECNICCDFFTSRQTVVCGFCDFKACRKCNQTYLLGVTDLTHCMNCKKKWELDFCLNNLTKTFMRNKYRDHRKKLLFETEKSRFPETMPLVANYMKIGNMEKEYEKLNTLERELRQKLRNVKEMKNKINQNIYLYRNGRQVIDDKKEKKVFMKPCPVNDCRGFLSTAWKCGVCSIYVCSKCFEIKGNTKDAEHTCNEDNLKAVELIKKETKNCPACGVMIYRISGCDQMWCTQCQIAFSWKTGLRVSGVIHNPHFYEFRRQNGNQLRNAGELHCGGLPGYHILRTKIRKNYLTDKILFLSPDYDWKNKKYKWKLYNRGYVMGLIHREILHFQQMELNPLRRNLNQLVDNTQLRIKYLSKEIDEKSMKTSLIRNDNARNKKTAILHIYELLNTVLTEYFIDMYNNMNNENFDKNLRNGYQILSYANNELIKISATYNQVVTLFGPNFQITKSSPIKFCGNRNNYEYTGMCDRIYDLHNLDKLPLNNHFAVDESV